MNFDLKHYLKKPLFIALEGLDGVGKSTQAKLLCDLLNDEGITTTITAEAKGSPIADVIRSEYLTGKRRVDNMVNALAFSADRYDRFTEAENGVIPRINRGESVIADRWVLSSMVYSAEQNTNIDHTMSLMLDINETLINAINWISIPVVIYISYEPEYADKFLTRVKTRGDQEIYESAETQSHLRTLYETALTKINSYYRISVTPDTTMQELHNMIVEKIIDAAVNGGNE